MKIRDIIGYFRPKKIPPVDQLMSEVERECSDYLELVRRSQQWLYRGSRSKPVYYKDVSRENRRPLHSNPLASQLFDESLKLVGATALRSNSIFTATNLGTTNIYGPPWVIFPVNGFEYTFTDDPDLIVTANRLPWDLKKLAQWASRVRPWLEQQKATPIRDAVLSDLSAVIEQGVLSQWFFTSYQKLEEKSPLPPELQPNWKQFLDASIFRDMFDPQTQKNNTLYRGMREGVEVLIRGQYHAFSVANYAKSIENKFGVQVSRP